MSVRNLNILCNTFPWPEYSEAFNSAPEVWLNYENRALSDLFDQLNRGIILISVESDFFYCNSFAKNFFAEVMNIEQRSKIKDVCRKTLYRFLKNPSSKAERYAIDDHVYEIQLDAMLKPEQSTVPYTIYRLSVLKQMEEAGQKVSFAQQYELSKRHMQIIQYIHRGCTNREIAEKLHLSIHTINRYVEDILRITASKNRCEACRKVLPD